MRRVSELIQEYCPNGVEFKKLGEIVTIKTGKTVNKGYIAQNPGKYPVINSGVEPLGYVNTYNTVDDELGVTSRGAGVGTVLWTEGKYFRGGLNYGLTPKTEVGINKRFLYHVLLHSKHAIDALCVFSGIPALNASNLERLEIPLPPLPVQQQIVSILDTFTELIAELTAELAAELAARKKQYELYREELLKLEGVEGVEWKKLGELLGYEQPTKYIVKSTGYDESYETPVLTAGQTFILGYTDEVEGIYQATKDKPVIIFDDFTTGFHWVDFDFKVKSSAMKFLKPKHDGVNFRYIYHCMRTLPFELDGHRRRWIREYSELEIPIPSLAEQERIVSILDKFDTLTNSLTEGISAEIEARQKQYEFYREKLLTFKRRD